MKDVSTKFGNELLISGHLTQLSYYVITNCSGKNLEQNNINIPSSLPDALGATVPFHSLLSPDNFPVWSNLLNLLQERGLHFIPVVGAVVTWF